MECWTCVCMCSIPSTNQTNWMYGWINLDVMFDENNLKLKKALWIGIELLLFFEFLSIFYFIFLIKYCIKKHFFLQIFKLPLPERNSITSTFMFCNCFGQIPRLREFYGLWSLVLDKIVLLVREDGHSKTKTQTDCSKSSNGSSNVGYPKTAQLQWKTTKKNVIFNKNK